MYTAENKEINKTTSLISLAFEKATPKEFTRALSTDLVQVS